MGLIVLDLLSGLDSTRVELRLMEHLGYRYNCYILHVTYVSGLSYLGSLELMALAISEAFVLVSSLLRVMPQRVFHPSMERALEKIYYSGIQSL